MMSPAFPLMPFGLKQPPRPPFPGQPGYLANGTPGATPLLPNNGRVLQSGPTRILCVADVRGKNLRRRISMVSNLVGQ